MAYKIKSAKKKERLDSQKHNPYFVEGKDMSKVPIYYLEGEYGLSENQGKALWQYGVDTGQVWQLQGWYGRTASDMLNSGYLNYPEKRTKDYYGNKIPTQKEAKQGHFDKD